MSTISRRELLGAGATAALASAVMGGRAAAAEGEPAPKNVLFIGVDDLRCALGCYGDTLAKTPSLDALAARGTRFDNAYCQFPLCSPARTSLMTGLAPDTTRVHDLQTHFRTTIPDVVTLAQLFRKNGYYAQRVGKIYHAGVPDDIGLDSLDDAASWDRVYNPDGVDHTREEPLLTKFTPTRSLGSGISLHPSAAPDEAMTDSLGADEVIRFLKRRQDRPFFLAYGLYRPHVPWIVPQKYFDLFPLESIQTKPFHPEELEHIPPVALFTHPVNFGMDEMQSRRSIQAYYAAAAFMDAQVGRVLAALKETGREENTVVVFWADHGWSLGEHGQWMKQTLFEPAARIPLIFAGPGIKAGGVSTRTAEHLDIYPTLAELCGLQGTPTNLQGASLAPLLKDPSAPWSKPAVSEVTRGAKSRGCSLRNERYRYTAWFRAETGEELYDYETDPHEFTNLAGDKAHADLKAAMRAQLAAIVAKRGGPAIEAA